MGPPGFLVFTVAPGLGLPPELPGVPSAALGPRQIWWVATAAAAAMGLGLVCLKRSPWASVLGLTLIALPHLISAPSLMSWALLGSFTAVVYTRFSANSARALA